MSLYNEIKRYQELSEKDKTMYNLHLWKLLNLPEETMLDWRDEHGNCLAMGYDDDAVNALMGATKEQRAWAYELTVGIWEGKS